MNGTTLIAAGLIAAAMAAGAHADATDNSSTTKAAANAAAPAAVTTTPVSPWKNSLVADLNLSQAHYSDWVSGGSDTLSWVGQIDGSSTFTQKMDTWANNLKLAYGESTIGSQTQKTSDAIHADTTYTEVLNRWVNPYAGASWDTQFNTGYNYNVGGVEGANVALSQFQDPGYLLESAGAGSSLGPLTLRVGAAARQTFAEGPYNTVTKFTPDGQAVYDQYGVSGMLGLKLALAQNLLFSSEVDLFSNLDSMDDVDVTCDNLLSAKVYSWLSANINCDIIYNNVEATGGQLYEGLSLTFSYTLI